MNVLFHRGVYLPDLNLWLDSRVKRQSSFVSHAHTDHVARHRAPVLTRGTLRLLRPMFQSASPVVLDFCEPLETPDYTLTLHPAGHCLGSAQVLIRSHRNEERILYTGDFKLWPNPAAEPLEPVPCDTLIMECTFGRPVYTFPPEEEVLERLFQLLHRWLSQGYVPVVLGYRVGKSQEVMRHLLRRGFHMAVEASIYQVCQAYQELGIEFDSRIRPFDGRVVEGEVLVYPPGGKRSKELRDVRSKRLVQLTGWAVHPSTKHRFGVDEALPLSDHPDFHGLLRYVDMVKPKRVFTVNGFPELAHHLRAKGYEAAHLDHNPSPVQLRLV